MPTYDLRLPLDVQRWMLGVGRFAAEELLWLRIRPSDGFPRKAHAGFTACLIPTFKSSAE